MSNKNAILNWSFDKPTEEGFYMACRGDVETTENATLIRVFKANPTDLGLSAKDLDGAETWLSFWHDSWKFAKLCIGAEAAGMEE